MTPEQQALLDELAEITMRKGPCSYLDDVEPREAGCASFCKCGGSGEDLDPRLENLRQVLWVEHPLGAHYRVEGDRRYQCRQEQCELCKDTAGYIRRIWDGLPKGALAGSIRYVTAAKVDSIEDSETEEFTWWLDLLDAIDGTAWDDDPDASVASVVLAAVKARV